jgi:hypothetical protein
VQVDSKEAIDSCFGQHAAFRDFPDRNMSSAYMLVYIRESSLAEVKKA